MPLSFFPAGRGTALNWRKATFFGSPDGRRPGRGVLWFVGLLISGVEWLGLPLTLCGQARHYAVQDTSSCPACRDSGECRRQLLPFTSTASTAHRT